MKFLARFIWLAVLWLPHLALAQGGQGPPTLKYPLTAGNCMQAVNASGQMTTASAPCGSGAGTVTSVTAGNSTITVGGTATDPTIAASVGSTSGTVAAGNDTRFPASVTGIRKGAGAGSADTAATPGVDYLSPTGSGAGLSGVALLSGSNTFLGFNTVQSCNATSNGSTTIQVNSGSGNFCSGANTLSNTWYITLSHTGTNTISVTTPSVAGGELTIWVTESATGNDPAPTWSGITVPSSVVLSTSPSTQTPVFVTYNGTAVSVTGGIGVSPANNGLEYSQYGNTTTFQNNVLGTLTANGILYGGGAGQPMAATTAMTNGQLLVGQTSAAPAPETVSNDATLAASGAITVVGINSTNLAGLSSGILKNTTGTGVPSIASALLDFSPAAAVNAQTGTSYAVSGTDNGKLITMTNASSMAVSLSQATTTGFRAGFHFCISDINATSTSATAAGNTAFVTITPTTSTINGAATLILGAQQGVCVYSDGTNYQTSQIFGIVSNHVVITATGTTTYTLPPNVTNVRVYICGGGGGGGAGVASATDGAGGGGGAWCNRDQMQASTIGAAGTTVTVTVGLGGTAGVVGGAAAGAGGQSSFGSFFNAFGGGPGLVAGATAGGGGGPGGPFTAGSIGTTTCGTPGRGAANGAQAWPFNGSCGGNGSTTTGGNGGDAGNMAAGGGSGGNGNASGGNGGEAFGCIGQPGGAGATTGTGGSPSQPTEVRNLPGCGGGGGGGATTGTGGAGGAGANGGGGGGGGGSASGAGTGGAGGAGGTGIAVIDAW